MNPHSLSSLRDAASTRPAPEPAGSALGNAACTLRIYIKRNTNDLKKTTLKGHFYGGQMSSADEREKETHAPQTEPHGTTPPKPLEAKATPSPTPTPPVTETHAAAPSETPPRPVERRAGARGTAAMDPQTRKEVARKGGLAVSRNKQHMAEIGRKGGQSVSKNREHMAVIGRKGGAASRGHR